MKKYLAPLIALSIAALALLKLIVGDEIARPPGMLAPEAPEQSPLARAEAIALKEFQLQPQARYRLEARVLAVERYRADAGAALAPVDFAVGWGPMSDSATLKHFRVTQGSRFYTLYPDEDAIDIATALRSSANMHLIPANRSVRDTLGRARPGSIATLSGLLVNVSRDDGFTWHTSLSREDSGAGACELMYVESVTLR